MAEAEETGEPGTLEGASEGAREGCGELGGAEAETDAVVVPDAAHDGKAADADADVDADVDAASEGDTDGAVEAVAEARAVAELDGRSVPDAVGVQDAAGAAAGPHVAFGAEYTKDGSTPSASPSRKANRRPLRSGTFATPPITGWPGALMFTVRAGGRVTFAGAPLQFTTIMPAVVRRVYTYRPLPAAPTRLALNVPSGSATAAAIPAYALPSMLVKVGGSIGAKKERQAPLALELLLPALFAPAATSELTFAIAGQLLGGRASEYKAKAVSRSNCGVTYARSSAVLPTRPNHW
jgi:hypothetical protein